MRILIVEDDESVGRFLRQACEEAGYRTELVQDGLEAVAFATDGGFDLILLDVMLPGLDGFGVARRVREAKVATPILLVTARDHLEDKIRGLDSGADDYVVKPFQVAELLARIRALLRRRHLPPAAPVLQVDDLRLDLGSRLATRADRSFALSATEFSLLEYLMRHPGQVLTRRMLLEHVWQYDFSGNDNVLHVYINYLRKKVDHGHPRPLIQTVRGAGYRMGT